jgi:hypothetical protein
MTDDFFPADTEGPLSIDGTPFTAPPQVELLLQQAIDLVEGARPMPLSTSSMINKEELLEVLLICQQSVPDELKSARWLLKESEEYKRKITRHGDDILNQARDRAAHMVERTEVVKAAEARARQITEQANDEARRMRLEIEDYCDHKLGSFEAILERTRTQVAEGRAKLQRTALDDQAAAAAAAQTAQQVPVAADGPNPAANLPDPGVADFFDQDG